MKKKVLIITGHYYPSIKAGGPVRSIINVINNLSNKFQFYVVTSDRDLGDSKPFENVKVDKWVQQNKAIVYYTDSSKLNILKLNSIINSIDYDAIYLNSFFSFKFSIIPMFLAKFRLINTSLNRPIIIAPRGEFSVGALSLKNNKKRFFLSLSKSIKLYKNVGWHATNDIERENIDRVMGRQSNIITANNLTKNYKGLLYEKKLHKLPGILKIVYISRIHPMKNLLQALQVLANVNGDITFSIYGPIEDQHYWQKCKEQINLMPRNVRVLYHGILKNEDVHKVLNDNHIFFLLTLGENFGHAISEAFIGGCPVLISDQTPWRNLESENVGWDLPLTNSEVIKEKINFFIKLDHKEYTEMSEAAFNYGKKSANQDTDIIYYEKMFANLKT